jgi:hypothetical protein
MRQRSVRLSPDEAWELTASAHTGILTTLRRDGTPVALPVWFVVRERKIVVSTPSRAKKVARLRSDPRFSFLVEGGKRWDELHGVQWSGTSVKIYDTAGPARVDIDRLVDEKYGPYITPARDMPKATAEHYERQGGTVAIELEPDDRFLSWDNARLGVARTR